MKYIRPIALLGFLLCILVIYLHLAPEQFLLTPGDVVGIQYKIISLSIFGFLFLIVLINPELYIFIGLILALGGLSNIYAGGNILGLLFYVFAMSIGLKQGFFRSFGKTKTAITVLIFFIVLCFQLRQGFQIFLSSFMNIAILIFLVTCFLLMFRENLKEYFAEKGQIDLAKFGFSKRQLSCIHGCLLKKTLQEIADENVVSVSVIKKEMQRIYELFGIEDRYDMFILINQNTFVFPKEEEAC